MSRPDLATLLAEVRDLARRSQSGRSDAFDAYRDLASLLLHYTILAPNTILAPTGAVRLTYGPSREGQADRHGHVDLERMSLSSRLVERDRLRLRLILDPKPHPWLLERFEAIRGRLADAR